MPLFEVAILELPTKKEAEEENAIEKLVFGPTFILAKDQQTAAMKAVMNHPEKMTNINKERMTVLVRPFV